MQKAATAGIAALGLRQSKDLNPLCTIVGPLPRPCPCDPEQELHFSDSAAITPSHHHALAEARTFSGLASLPKRGLARHSHFSIHTRRMTLPET